MTASRDVVGARDRQVAAGRPRRDRRRDRDGLLHRRRGPPLLRADDDERDAEPAGDDVRQPLGVAGLIIAANTPIANVAWKVFPALLCGNAAVLKASEDTPQTRARVRPARGRGRAAAGRAERRPRLRRRGGPAARRGRARRRRQLHRLDGGGPDDRRGSPASGWRRSASSSAARTRSSSATTPTSRRRAEAAALSAFCNAGQRCAAGSRMIVFDASTTASASCCSSGRAPSAWVRETSTTSAR